MSAKRGDERVDDFIYLSRLRGNSAENKVLLIIIVWQNTKIDTKIIKWSTRN